MTGLVRAATASALLTLVFSGAHNLTAQATSPGPDGPIIKLGGSPNVRLLSHLPLEGFFYNGGIDIEQELSRPYAYVPLWLDKAGFVVIDIEDPENPEIIYRWEIENAELHQFGRGETGKYFRTGDRYYYVKTTVFGTAGPDPDSCAVVFDVTGLPDPASVREVGRIRSPDIVTGCLSVFPYKHSDGRTLLLAGVRGATPGTEPHGKIYDMDRFLAGDADQGYVGPVPLPDLGLGPTNSAYHDLYAAYDVARGRDVVYGGGAGGYHMYDMTVPEAPGYLGSISGTSGVQRGHTIIATPDARYAVTQMEYQFAPMMVFDLAPIHDGITQRISRPLGAWIADWRDLAHNMEVRWPYVFVAAYEDGLQIFDIRDPANPLTLGWHYTCHCPPQTGFGGGDRIRGTSVFNGAMEVDVRNEDGLIVVSDLNTGARPIATSTISFGLVSVPVKLYATGESKSRISFNMVHKDCGTRVKQQYICPKDDVIVPREDMVKGYEFAKGQYVLFTPEELKAVEQPKTDSIQITEFVPADQVDRLFLDRAYYLGPDKGGNRAYLLLSAALKETERVAIAKYATRGKQYLVMVRPFGEGLLMEQLRYADEVRDFADVPVDEGEGEGEVDDSELKLAVQLVDQASSDEFEAKEYKDEVRDRMLELIQQKVDGEEIVSSITEEPQTQIIDLMAALKASPSDEGQERKPARKASSKKKTTDRKKASSG